MRKLLLSVLLSILIIASLGAKGSLTIKNELSLPLPLKERLIHTYEKLSGVDSDIVISDVLEREDGIFILTLLVEGESYRLALNGNELSTVDDSFKNFLVYLPKTSEGEVLNYIYTPSYSSISLKKKSAGQVYHLKGENGKSIATFISDKERYGSSTLNPFYIKESYVNLPLEKGLGLRVTTNIGLIFSPEVRVSGKVMLSTLPFTYPFMPTIGFSYLKDRNDNNVYTLLAGASYHLSLGRVFSSHFTLVEDGSLSANVALVLGTNGNLVYGSSWTLMYEHAISNNLFWSLGVGQETLWQKSSSSVVVSQYTLNIGMGVLL